MDLEAHVAACDAGQHALQDSPCAILYTWYTYVSIDEAGNVVDTGCIALRMCAFHSNLIITPPELLVSRICIPVLL